MVKQAFGHLVFQLSNVAYRLPKWLSGKEFTCQCRRRRFDPWVWEDPLEKGMATHSTIFAWRIPWTEEAGGLQSMELQKVRHNWVTNICLFNTFNDFNILEHVKKKYFSNISLLTYISWGLLYFSNLFLSLSFLVTSGGEKLSIFLLY